MKLLEPSLELMINDWYLISGMIAKSSILSPSSVLASGETSNHSWTHYTMDGHDSWTRIKRGVCTFKFLKFWFKSFIHSFFFFFSLFLICSFNLEMSAIIYQNVIPPFHILYNLHNLLWIFSWISLKRFVILISKSWSSDIIYSFIFDKFLRNNFPTLKWSIILSF